VCLQSLERAKVTRCSVLRIRAFFNSTTRIVELKKREHAMVNNNNAKIISIFDAVPGFSARFKNNITEIITIAETTLPSSCCLASHCRRSALLLALLVSTFIVVRYFPRNCRNDNTGQYASAYGFLRKAWTCIKMSKWTDAIELKPAFGG
jgi:hypothetical protein